MAKTKIPKTKQPRISNAELDRILNAKPCITKKQMRGVEGVLGGQNIAVARRIGLLVLTMGVPKLRRSITEEHETAEAFADAFVRIRWAIERYEGAVEMLQASEVRLLGAFVDRPDAEKLWAAAKADFESPEPAVAA